MCYYNYLAYPCCWWRIDSEFDRRGREFEWVRFYNCYGLPEVLLKRLKVEGTVEGVEDCPYGLWYNDPLDDMDYELLRDDEINCPWCEVPPEFEDLEDSDEAF